MKNLIKSCSIGFVFVALLAACDPKIEVKVGCQLLEAAGVTHNFHLTPDEKRVMTREHKIILANILDWYRSHC